MSELRTSYLVGRAHRILRVTLEEALADAEITVNELTALSVLASRPGLSNARLARRSLVSPQAMHKVVRSLEDRDLVIRSAPPSGGRSLEAFITDAGRQVLAEAEPLLARAEQCFLASLNRDERATLDSMLLRISGLAPGSADDGATPPPD